LNKTGYFLKEIIKVFLLLFLQKKKTLLKMPDTL